MKGSTENRRTKKEPLIAYMPHDKTYLAFLLPAIISIFILVVVPFVYAFYISLHDLNLMSNKGRMTFVGLKNYLQFFHDRHILTSTWVTLKLFVIASLAEAFFGLVIAFILDREFKGKSVFRSVLLTPMFITSVVVGLTWRAMLDPLSGVINWFLGDARIEFLGRADLALVTVALVDAWQWTPLVAVMCMSSLDSIPNDLHEAAVIDGASELKTIRFIKLPLIKNALIVTMILRCVEILKLFSTIYVMTSGGPGNSTETLNMYAYHTAFEYFRVGYATTIAFMFSLVTTLTLGYIISRCQKKGLF